ARDRLRAGAPDEPVDERDRVFVGAAGLVGTVGGRGLADERRARLRRQPRGAANGSRFGARWGAEDGGRLHRLAGQGCCQPNGENQKPDSKHVSPPRRGRGVQTERRGRSWRLYSSPPGRKAEQAVVEPRAEPRSSEESLANGKGERAPRSQQ